MAPHSTNGSTAARGSNSHGTPPQPVTGVEHTTAAPRTHLKDNKSTNSKETTPPPAKKGDGETNPPPVKKAGPETTPPTPINHNSALSTLPPPAKKVEQHDSRQNTDTVQVQDVIGKIKQNNQGILSLCQEHISTLLRDIKDGVDQQQELARKMEEEMAKMDRKRKEELDQLRANLNLQREREVQAVREEMQSKMKKMEAEMREREAKVQEQLKQVMAESDNNLRTVQEQFRKWEETRREEREREAMNRKRSLRKLF